MKYTAGTYSVPSHVWGSAEPLITGATPLFIAVVGITGSGISTLAYSISKLKAPNHQTVTGLPCRRTAQKLMVPKRSLAERVRIFEIPGYLESRSINALGDSGAKHNFMNEDFALRSGLEVDRADVRKVRIGSGLEITTKGSVTSTFRFQDEYDYYSLVFHILPNSLHDVILGKPFLGVTQTLTKFFHRIKEKVVKAVSQQRHMLYLGASGPRFEGYVKNVPQAALGDTGSKVAVLDEDFARRIGVPIHNTRKYRTWLRFADNSTVRAAGMAFGVEWKFGGSETPYLLDFHILKNASSSVILCDTFLFDTRAFSQYQDCLFDEDHEDNEYSHCFAIDKDRKYQPQRDSKALSLEEMEYLENVRRGEVADRIAKLPAEEQETARINEEQTQANWLSHFNALKDCEQAQQEPDETEDKGRNSDSLARPKPKVPFKERFKWIKFKRIKKPPNDFALPSTRNIDILAT